MTPTLVLNHPGPELSATTAPGSRARDWTEVQERMLTPLYEAVYERMEVGAGTRLLCLGGGSGLAMLVAAARGARVTGALPGRDAPGPAPADGAPYTLVAAFEPIGGATGDAEWPVAALRAAVPLAARGSSVVLTGWGPPERCATTAVLRVASRLAEHGRPPRTGSGSWRPTLRDDLEDVAARAGLRPDGSGRVSCPLEYADVGDAVRALLATGLFDAAVRAVGRTRVGAEVAGALRPHRRQDGTVRMPNVFRYLICVT